MTITRIREAERFRHEPATAKFRASDVIFKEGAPGDVAYVVQSGTVDLYIGGRLVESVGPDGLIGELALIDQEPRSADAIARTDCALVPIDQARFNELVKDTPGFAVDVLRILAQRIRATQSAG